MPGRGSTTTETAKISQYKVDYQPWKLERTQKIEIRPQWESPTGPVDGRTETADQFPVHSVEPRKQRVMPEWQPPADKFGGESVNKSDFQPKYLPKEQPVRPKDEIERTTAPFTAMAGSREEYKTWEPQQRYKHEHPSYHRPDGTMETCTSYSAEFTPGRSQVRLPPIRPPVLVEKVKPFQGVSESTERYRDYQPLDMAVAKQTSCKPHVQYRPPSRPLETRSSYAGDFVRAGDTQSERTRPVLHVGELQLLPDPMETRTTSKGDFAQPAVVERMQPIRHGGELYWPSEPFSGQSTQRGDFSPRWQPRRQPIRHGGELQVSNDSFAARTVMQDDFVARPGERPSPVRQAGELHVSNDPMVSTTTNRDVYTPKRRDGPPPLRRRKAPAVIAAGVAEPVLTAS